MSNIDEVKAGAFGPKPSRIIVLDKLDHLWHEVVRIGEPGWSSLPGPNDSGMVKGYTKFSFVDVELGGVVEPRQGDAVYHVARQHDTKHVPWPQYQRSPFHGDAYWLFYMWE